MSDPDVHRGPGRDVSRLPALLLLVCTKQPEHQNRFLKRISNVRKGFLRTFFFANMSANVGEQVGGLLQHHVTL